jgi:hypothetical protein
MHLSILQQPALVQLLPTACEGSRTLLQRRGCLFTCSAVELLLVQPSPLWLKLLLYTAAQQLSGANSSIATHGRPARYVALPPTIPELAALAWLPATIWRNFNV